MKKFEFKRLRIFRILSIIFLIIGTILIIKFHNQPQTQQVFQINNVQTISKEELNKIGSQNIPIPEDIQKQINERLEQEKIAKEQAEAEQKAKEETERKIQLAKKQSQKITSRSATTSRQEATTSQATGTKAEYQSYAKNLCINTYGWTENDVQCLIKLWERESGWNANSHNKSSGAHGIPQALPASKMASEGSDYYTNGYTQIRWGLKYIQGRYGNPSNAWAHSQSKGWY